MPFTRIRAILRPLLARRELWLPTWRGWLLLLAALAVFGAALLICVYPFLAVSDPLTSGALVVEGWGNRSTMRQAGERFQAYPYSGFYVTGGPTDLDSVLDDYGTFANLGLIELQRVGAPPAIPVPAERVRRDRTFTSALALRDYLRAHGGVPHEITVVSEGAHTRRTRLLYQKAFGPQTHIGALAAHSETEYDARRWWTYSAGFRDVVGEAIAYLYARFLFWQTGS